MSVHGRLPDDADPLRNPHPRRAERVAARRLPRPARRGAWTAKHCLPGRCPTRRRSTACSPRSKRSASSCSKSAATRRTPSGSAEAYDHSAARSALTPAQPSPTHPSGGDAPLGRLGQLSGGGPGCVRARAVGRSLRPAAGDRTEPWASTMPMPRHGERRPFRRRHSGAHPSQAIDERRHRKKVPQTESTRQGRAGNSPGGNAPNPEPAGRRNRPDRVTTAHPFRQESEAG